MVLVLWVVLIVVFGVWIAPEASAKKPPSFIQVGEIYDLHAADAMLTAEVLEIRSDGWLKIKERSSGKLGWINLEHLWGIKQPR